MDFFDIGIIEILVILAVALIVIGPERIPEFARKIGQIVRSFRKITTGLTTEMKKAMDLDEEAEEMKKAAEEMEGTLDAEAKEVKKTLGEGAKELSEALDKEAKEVTETIETETKKVKKTLGEGTKELSEALDKEAKEITETIKADAKEIKERLGKEAEEAGQTIEEAKGATKAKKPPDTEARVEEEVVDIKAKEKAPKKIAIAEDIDSPELN